MPMQHMARDTLIQTLLILLVITMVVMFLATSFVRPVNDLIARVQLARTGKTDMTFAAESTDEIGDLARSFRELIGSVQKQTRMLEEATSGESAVARERDAERIWRNACASRKGEITERVEDVTVVFAELKGLAEYTQAVSDSGVGDDAEAADRRIRRGRIATRRRADQDRGRYLSRGYGFVAAVARPHAPHRRVRTCGTRDRADFNREKTTHLGLTVGIGSGPVIADVMGHGQFLFQLWGAAVIAADHAMDCGAVNDIVVTRAVRDGLADQYTFKPLQASTSDVPLWTLEARD